MADKADDHLREASKQMPPEAVKQMEVVLRRIFAEETIPYDASHLKAALGMCKLIHPHLPPMYSEFIATSVLLLYRLIDDQEKTIIV